MGSGMQQMGANGMNPPPGGSNMDLAFLAAGSNDPMASMMMGAPMPNQCCAHGAMHSTMPSDPMMQNQMMMQDPMMMQNQMMMQDPMMMQNQMMQNQMMMQSMQPQGSSLPPIDQQQPGLVASSTVGPNQLYNLSAARTPHGGIKPGKVCFNRMIYEVFDLIINSFLTENKTTEERRVVQQEEI